MNHDADQRPAPGLQTNEGLATGRPTWVQRLLAGLIVLFVAVAAGLWLRNIRPVAITTGVLVLALGVLFYDGVQRDRNNSTKGSGMSKLWPFGPRSGPSAPPQRQDQRGAGGGVIQLEPGKTADPLPPAHDHPRGSLVPTHAPHKGAHQGPRNASAPQAKLPSGGPWPEGVQLPGAEGAPLPEPPVFAGRSTPGQAPWHLPVGSAPTGLAADGIRLGDLEVRAASVVGAGHRCEEPAVARQDSYSLGRTRDGGFLVIAIADGVSQSKHSDLAARVAVTAATRELTQVLEAMTLDQIDPTLLYRKIAGEIVGTARDRGIAEQDVCAILITAVIPTRPRVDGTRPIWVSWIGDVSMWISRDGELRRRTGDDKTGLDRNALHAVLPFNPGHVEERITELRPYDRVAFMTDGVSDSFGSVGGASDYFAHQWAQAPPHPASFLHSLCYDAPGQTDDRTAVVVWCGADER